MFPWDTLTEHGGCRRPPHPEGIVDLSVGTPVDPVAPVIRAALAEASAAPGYPWTAGTPETGLRRGGAAAPPRDQRGGRFRRPAGDRFQGTDRLAAHPVGPGTRGSGGDPGLAYPTYEVGARLAGAGVTAADSLTQLGPRTPAVIYLNSPSNPTGKVLGVEHLRKVVQWARARNGGGLRRVLPGTGLGGAAGLGAASGGQ